MPNSLLKWEKGMMGLCPETPNGHCALTGFYNKRGLGQILHDRNKVDKTLSFCQVKN
jgi:hypothetical protein